MRYGRIEEDAIWRESSKEKSSTSQMPIQEEAQNESGTVNRGVRPITEPIESTRAGT
jgi:hypothetical protein